MAFVFSGEDPALARASKLIVNELKFKMKRFNVTSNRLSFTFLFSILSYIVIYVFKIYHFNVFLIFHLEYLTWLVF